ncbi:MAG: hypothetical protein J6A47_01635 [Bacilli bacterium]|nr:hypothetical protein [Bacilli bacterium]
MVSKLKEYCLRHDIAIYISLLGSLIMGTIPLVSVLLKFDWASLNYCIFSYLMAVSVAWQWAIEKFHVKPHPYVAAIISMALIIAPMMASFVLTILSKDAPVSSTNWLIYIYALYGMTKMVLAIRDIVRKRKSPKQYALSFLGLSSALYTMQMMEISLIAAFGDSQDNAMYMLQLFTQGAIFLISLFMVEMLVYKTLAKKRDQDAVA